MVLGGFHGVTLLLTLAQGIVAHPTRFWKYSR
jgi:hypothetical protein